MATKRSFVGPLSRGLSLAFLIGIAGCATGVGVPSTTPVRGVVKYKGVPAPGIRVKFHSRAKQYKGQFIPIGDTGPDGGFTLSTGAPNNGAPPGEYAVTFEKPELSPTESVETEIDAFQGKYSDPARSTFLITIQRGENPLPPFELD